MMQAAVAATAFWLGVLLCVPSGFVLLEVVAGCLRRSRTPAAETDPDTVVLIPAHDERLMLPAALARLRETAGPRERVLVIADNCSDDTADLARAAGAEVIERTDPSERGKPYALAWALQRLASAPPEVVVVLDADCWFTRGNASQLARCAVACGRPVQGVYRTEGGTLRDFAFRFRGEARNRGLVALGGPCLLGGSGFAVPWAALVRVPVPVGELAEDAVWGWRFAAADLGARYAPEIEVCSVLPASAAGVRVQQHRWEYGVMSSTLRHLPLLLRRALLPPRWSGILLALESLVPPLALLVLLAVLALGAGLVSGGFGTALPAAMAMAMLTAAVGLGWWRYARRELPLRKLLAAPWYAVRKLGLYVSFLTRRSKAWVRTDRDEP